VAPARCGQIARGSERLGLCGNVREPAWSAASRPTPTPDSGSETIAQRRYTAGPLASALGLDGAIETVVLRAPQWPDFRESMAIR